MTDWNALLGLKEFTVVIEGWPREIPVAASSAESAIAKARAACVGTTRNAAWFSASATAVAA